MQSASCNWASAVLFQGCTCLGLLWVDDHCIRHSAAGNVARSLDRSVGRSVGWGNFPLRSTAASSPSRVELCQTRPRPYPKDWGVQISSSIPVWRGLYFKSTQAMSNFRCRAIWISGYTQKCRFMDKEMREISRFFVAQRRAFPLSVWRGFTHIPIHKYLYLSRFIK